MSAELDYTTGRAGIAYVQGHETPWHGEGQTLDPNATPDAWRIAAGLDWEVEKRSVLHSYTKADGTNGAKLIEDRKALVRTDTQTSLSVVSNRYQPVQPHELFDTFTKIADATGARLNTAGSLKGGRRIWALAEMDVDPIRISGNDTVLPYLLLNTTFDGSGATIALPTTVRVVCQNTLSFALGNGGDIAKNDSLIRVTHGTKFEVDEAAARIIAYHRGVQDFGEQAQAMAERRVEVEEVTAFFRKLLGAEAVTVNKESGDLDPSKKFEALVKSYMTSPGAEMRSAHGTVWGLVNGVTHFVDHEARARSNANRLDSAWFGAGASLKAKAWDQALEMAA